LTTKKIVEIDGTKIAYMEAGPDQYVGTPLLLVHGFLVHSGSWRDIIPGLSEKYRILAPDLPGFGDSGMLTGTGVNFSRFATFLNRFCEKLDVERAIIIGHSMGGAIAIVSCAMFPHRFVKGVFMDAAAYPFKAPLKARLPKIPVLGGIIFKHLYGWGMFQQYFHDDVFHDPSKMDLELVRDYYRSFDTPERRAYMHRILPAVTEGAEVEKYVPKVKQPTMVVWGSKDTLVPLAVGHRLEKELEDVRFELVPECGHPPQEECPAQTLALILDFLG
jgi:pimeloyl-ACP methyl ester carboxylesterase